MAGVVTEKVSQGETDGIGKGGGSARPVRRGWRGLAYAELFADRSALAFFSVGVVAKLPSGMLGLLLILLVQDATGSYAVAGAVVAAFAVGAGVISPFRGRIADRRGPRRVVLYSAIVHAVALVALALLAGRVPAAALMVIAVVTGGSIPPLPSVMRAAWSRRLTDPRLRHGAFSAESMSLDFSYVVGPLMAATGIAVIGARATTVVSAAAVVLSCALLARSRWLPEALPESRESGLLGALRTPGLWLLMPSSVGILLSVNAVEITAIAWVGGLTGGWVSGSLIAVFSVGGVLGGLAWGLRLWPGRPVVHLIVLHVTYGLLLAVLAVGWPPVVLAPLMFVTGLAFAPGITAQFTVADQVLPRAVVTEGFSWMSSAGQVGLAIAGAIVGTLIDAVGVAAGWWVAVAGAGLSILAALALWTHDRTTSRQ